MSVISSIVRRIHGLANANAGQILTPRMLHWGKLLIKFVSAQMLVQIVTMITGIVIIRTLEPTQYAYFVIANSMQATMNLLADLGISSGLSAIGGRVWQDRTRFSQLIATIFYLRRHLVRYAALVVTPILLWLLHKNGATPGLAITLTLLVLIEVNFKLTTSIYQMILRLQSEIGRLQNLDLLFALSRFGLIGLFYLFYMNSVTVLTTAVIASGVQRRLVGQWANDQLDKDSLTHEGDKKEILTLVRAQAPNTIYYCVQGQFTIWLISLFGSTQNIAEIGALSRLAIFYSLVSSVLTNIVIPSFARCQLRSQLFKRYWEILSGYVGLSALFVGIVVLFPDPILWILGPQYSDLQQALVLMTLNVAINGFTAVQYQINYSKGWIALAWLHAPVTITIQVIALFVLDLSSLHSIIGFGIVSAIPSLLINFYMSLIELRRVVNS